MGIRHYFQVFAVKFENIIDEDRSGGYQQTRRAKGSSNILLVACKIRDSHFILTTTLRKIEFGTVNVLNHFDLCPHTDKVSIKGPEILLIVVYERRGFDLVVKF